LVAWDSKPKLLRASQSLYQHGHETLLAAINYKRYILHVYTTREYNSCAASLFGSSMLAVAVDVLCSHLHSGVRFPFHAFALTISHVFNECAVITELNF